MHIEIAFYDPITNIIRLVIVALCVTLGIIVIKHRKKWLGIAEITLGIIAPALMSYYCLVGKNNGVPAKLDAVDWEFLRYHNNNFVLTIIIILYVLLVITTFYNLVSLRPSKES